MNMPQNSRKFSIAVHGGAGIVIQGQADEAPYHAALAQALVVTAVLLRRRHAEERVQRVSDAREYGLRR